MSNVVVLEQTSTSSESGKETVSPWLYTDNTVFQISPVMIYFNSFDELYKTY